MKYLLIIMIISTTLFSSMLIDRLDNIIKFENNQNLVKEYNEYKFENGREVLIFIDHYGYQDNFYLIYKKLNLTDKLNIIRKLANEPTKFKKIIKSLDLYNETFVETKIAKEQELQFSIYKLILLDKSNMFFKTMLETSEIKDHYRTIFNPYNLIKIDKRYKYYIKKILEMGNPISYINIIDYMMMDNEYKSKIEFFSFRKEYMGFVYKYMKEDSVVVSPIVINSIFYDKADKTKSIYVNHYFFIEGKLKDIMKDLNQKKFLEKHSFDLLKKLLKQKKLSKLDLDFFLKNIKFDINKFKILDDNYTYIETFDTIENKSYFSIKEFLNENSVGYIY